MLAKPDVEFGSIGGRLAWWATFFTCVLIMSCHFLLIWFSSMPLTPLSYNLRTIIRSYVHPYFDQDWRFFAPQPPTSSSWLIARAKYRSGGELRVTQWVNVSSALDEAVADDRLSPMATIHVLLSNALEDYQNEIVKQPGAVIVIHGKSYPRSPIPSHYLVADHVVMMAAGTVLLRHFYPSTHFDGEQVAILVREVQPFSKRFKPDRNPYGVIVIDWDKPPKSVPGFSDIR